MNKLACLFALVCCLSFAACLVEESFPHVGGVQYPPYYSSPLKSIFGLFGHGYGYPSYGMMHKYGSQIPYEGQYPYFYPYSSEYQHLGYGKQLPYSYEQYPYYQYPYYQYPYYQYQQQSIYKPGYNMLSSFSYPYSSYSSLSYPYYHGYPYNVQSPFPGSFPTSYPSVSPIQV